MTPTSGSLFTGYGGLDRAVEAVLGARPAWFAEHEPPTKKNPRPTQAAARLLAHRFPDVPNLGDVSAIDWHTVPRVNVLTGGFPCQGLSLAGKRLGLLDARSGLWERMAYAVSVLRPDLVVIENVRGLLSADADGYLEPCPWCVGDPDHVPLRALGAVLGDLAELGYDARWVGLRAADVGAPHARFRVFIAAWPTSNTDNGGWIRRAGQLGPGRWDESADGGDAATDADDDGLGQLGRIDTGRRDADRRDGTDRDGDATEPATPVPDADGLGRGAHLASVPAREPHPRWGVYADAVHRWERLTRLAPNPTTPNSRGTAELSARFVEWTMGLPAGWVTDVPGTTRKDHLRMLGNGVVPQQAEAALRALLDLPA